MNFLLYLFIGKKSSDKFVPGHLRQKRGRRTGSVHMSRAIQNITYKIHLLILRGIDSH